MERYSKGNEYFLYLEKCQGGIRPETNNFLPRFDHWNLIRLRIDPHWLIEIRELAESLIDRASEEQINELIKQDWLG